MSTSPFDPRLAGDIVRYHTSPVVRLQTNAAHSWQTVRILQAIWPGATLKAVVYVLYHDLGEIGAGDIPYPIKKNNPTIKASMDRLEHAAHADMQDNFMIPPLPELTDEERTAISIAHAVEMWEYGRMEMAMGNQLALPIVARTTKLVEELRAKSGSDPIWDRVHEYMLKREGALA